MTDKDKEVLFWTLAIQHYDHLTASYMAKGKDSVSKFYENKSKNAQKELERLSNGRG